MTSVQRIRNFLIGIIMIAAGVVMIAVPDVGFGLITAIISAALLIRGIRSLWFYLSMGRFAINGMNSLIAAVIQFDLGVITFSMTDFPKSFLILYLMVMHLFYGATDILMGINSRKTGKPTWKYDIIYGGGNIAIALASLIYGFVLGKINAVVYIYAAGLIYSGIVRTLNSFRRTAIVYIQ